MTDSEIRSRLHQSPEDGCRALYDTYFNYVYTITFQILRHCASREDVEECVSDVFMEVMQHYDQLRDGSVKAYIGTIAKNKAINMSHSVTARSKHFLPVNDEQFQALPDNQAVQEEVEAEEQSDILLACIQSLGEPDTSIILQKYFYDRNSVEIGKMLHLSSAAVRMRCKRAMKKLKIILSEKGISL